MISQMNLDTVVSHANSAMAVTNLADEKLAKAQVIMTELKQAGYSNKDLRELSLLVLLEMGCRVKNPRVDGHSI